MKTATRCLLRWVAVLLVRTFPLRILRGLERAIDGEVLRREIAKVSRLLRKSRK